MLQVYSHPEQTPEDDSADERERFLYGIEFTDSKADKKSGEKGQSKKAKVLKKGASNDKKKRDPLRDSKDSTPSGTSGFPAGDVNFSDPEKVWI